MHVMHQSQRVSLFPEPVTRPHVHRGDSRGPRRGCRDREREPHDGRRCRPRRDVDRKNGRQDADDDAEVRRGPHARPQPRVSPPRTAVGVSALARRAGPLDLRSERGRKSLRIAGIDTASMALRRVALAALLLGASACIQDLQATVAGVCELYSDLQSLVLPAKLFLVPGAKRRIGVRDYAAIVITITAQFV